MAKKMLIDATHAEETRVVVVDGNKVEEFDFESENKRQLAGNIYLAKVTRVEPSLQAAFVDYGGNRHGFLAFSEIHPDYYQIPVADREALMEEERAYAEAQRAEEDDEEKPKRSSRSRRPSSSRSRAESTRSKDATATKEVSSPENSGSEISGMETIDLEDEATPEGTSPMETVAETPVEEPTDETTVEATVIVTTEAKAPETEPAEGDKDNGTDLGTVEAMDKDDSIESVSDDDDAEDIRPVRKPRPRRYKIQEVIKVRQILLVQVVKEERGNKGAALTTYLSLAGRYCVLMPNTARGGGISRKITNAVDRKKLKEIAGEIDVPSGAGLIIRTAGAKRTKAEIKRDYEYLFRLWEQIRKLTLDSIAPAKIYEEGDLIKRSIRDLYNRDIDEVFVEGERGYRIAKDFMKMIMPSHAVNVKHYRESMPLFARYQVESYLSSMFNPTVQLKSGGYIVIGVTEALVAIDVNSGRATKEGSIEETATKTNLEAAEEVARQLRLRDLAGLIVIDFIDMDDRRNNAAVEKKIKDKLKTDRARIQIGRISGFGLLEMSRQRLRPGMIEATTQPCPACHGTGLIRSDDNLALSILRQIEEEGVRRRSREVLVKCPVGIANFIMNQKREHVAQIEGRYGLSVRVEGDPMLISPDFSLEKFKTATRVVIEQPMPVVSVDTTLMDQVDEASVEEEDEVEAVAVIETSEEDNKPKKRRRRRRRSRSKSSEGYDAESEGESSEDAVEDATEADTDEEAAKKPSTRSRSRSTKPKADKAVEAETPVEPQAAEQETPVEVTETSTTDVREPAEVEASAEPVAEQEPVSPEPAQPEVPQPAPELPEPVQPEMPQESEPVPEAPIEVEPVTPVEIPPEAVAEPEVEIEDPNRPKRRGWWSLGG
ncbi:Rne/Rng family ribonuclease [Thalassovita taeanensis]|nr:ribonuclease E/G [Thalassovita taeanensis]